MSKFGDDKALSLGGVLPPETVNGLPARYKELCRSGTVVYAVVALKTSYVKVFEVGQQANEPVLVITALEPGTGDDEQLLVDLMLRLRGNRESAQSNGRTHQGTLMDGDPDRDKFREWFEGDEFDPGQAKAMEMAWLAGRADLEAFPEDATAEATDRFEAWMGRDPTGFAESGETADLMAQAWTAGREHKMDHADDPDPSETEPSEADGSGPADVRGGHLAIAPPPDAVFEDGDPDAQTSG